MTHCDDDSIHNKDPQRKQLSPSPAGSDNSETTEQQLREAVENFELVFNLNPDGMQITRLSDGSVVAINDAATAMFHCARQDIVGRTTLEADIWDDRRDRQKVIDELRRTGRCSNYEAVFKRNDGTRFVGLMSSILFTHHDTPHVLTITRDITELKRAEQERQRLQAELFQAQKMEAIGTLAGGVAHDFNNILGGILGGLSVLEIELGEQANCQSDLQDMKALVYRGADLAKQLIGFARGGKYDVRPLDLARVLEHTSSMFSSTRRDITVALELSPRLEPVLMDHTQLEQVLLNLLLNAGQAMAYGGRIVLRAENDLPANPNTDSVAPERSRFVKLIVRDTGVGMDAATRERVFEPFFTTRSSGQSTGLGLAAVYGIIESHGGSIQVDSEPAKGTTVTLLLPTTNRPAPCLAVSDAPTPRGKATILLVDDDLPLLKVCSRLLRTMGYEVLTAPGGKEAIEAIREQHAIVSLVILDMTMPEMSGAKTYDALQQIAPGVKVLLSSGHSLEGQAQELLARGCVGFLQKPFSPAVLASKLRELM